uniref:IBH1-like N-terminal domain-containing protein n=1 Tax=Vitis vinifera TaxID=29760 RepID=F6I4T5_VITVI
MLSDHINPDSSFLDETTRSYSMEKSYMVTDSEGGYRSMESNRRKRKKMESGSQKVKRGGRWRTEAEQQIYSAKLVEAITKVRRSSAPAAAVHRGRAVREAADRVLAAAGKGRTRWSRAIMTSRVGLRLRKRRKVTVTGNNRLRKPAVSKQEPPLKRRVRVLGGFGLLPCEKGGDRSYKKRDKGQNTGRALLSCQNPTAPKTPILFLLSQFGNSPLVMPSFKLVASFISTHVIVTRPCLMRKS